MVSAVMVIISHNAYNKFAVLKNFVSLYISSKLNPENHTFAKQNEAGL